MEARKREEEEMRGRREREMRQRDLVQRQRRILQANLRSQQRWREKDTDTVSHYLHRRTLYVHTYHLSKVSSFTRLSSEDPFCVVECLLSMIAGCDQ